ncbi:MAG: pilus assembly protein, partial [Chloroflexota bacterium]
CAAIKNAGVTVYTIAFTGAASQSIQLLQNCATDLGHYYDATSGQAALATAFEQIAQSLNQLRISH